MKRISQIFLFGMCTVFLLAAACAPVEGVPNQPGALQDNLTGSPTTPATTDPSQATATNTTQTPSIPVTGLEVILLNCPYCVDNVAHDQLLIPRDATFRVTSPPELVRNGDDDDDDDNGEGRRLTTQLSGAEEVPGPGDPDGSGTATIRLRPEQGEVCFDLTVSNIGPATAAHIHEGAEGVAGPVVVPLDPAPTEGSSSGCISDVDTALIRNIVQNPGQYYVNVHNEEFPDGAIRGQLGHVDDGNNNGNNNNNNNNDNDDGEDEDDDNGDRLGCRVIDRFRDKKLVLCRAEENTTITMNVCLDDNNCTEVQITLQSCALGTGTPTAIPTLVVTTTTTSTTTTATFTPVPITATSTSTASTATFTPVAPATGTPTPTVVTNTPTASATGTPTATSTPTSTPTP